MLRMFGPGTKDAPLNVDSAALQLSNAVWIDLIEPTREEEQLVEQLIGTNVPTREEMQELLLLLSAHEKTSTLFVTHDVEEAVYLSTRILVFSARPGRIQKEIAVPFGDDRPLSIKGSSEFSRLKREIFDLLHAGQPSSFDRQSLLRKLTRKDVVEPVKS